MATFRFRPRPDNKMTLREVFLASVSGIILTLTFPKFNLSLLAWVALIPLLIAMEDKPSRKAFFLGWITGIVHFTSLLHWVTISMTQYGNLPVVISILLLVLLSLYLGLYVSIFGGILSFFRSRYLDDPVVIAPAIWILLEYLRTYLLSGFPWGLLGYSQYQNLSLIQISDLTGVYGVSFIIVLVNASIYLIIKWARSRSGPFPFQYTLSAIIILLVVLVYGNFRMDTIQNSNRNSPQLRVALIQGNIDQEQKWETAFFNETLLIYQKLTLAAAQDHSDLIVWPETAAPCYFMPELHGPFFLNLANKIKTPIVFGSLVYESQSMDSNESKCFNSAFLASPGEKVFTRYDKIHLVPFGEYVPLKPFLPFVKKMVAAGIGDFSPGRRYPLFSIPQAKFGVLICYEIIFPNLFRKYSESGADFLVNITNDTWFGRTGAPYQHFSMAVFRAIENRTALVRDANSGVSGIIEPSWHIQAETSIFNRTFLEGPIPVNP
ncbi:MAG: apolipoprotein N-acyltransferase, partial [Deltaproteobacteria bacterium]|nr:apolipoprotein N-acyltransferase [Deltaproteobacteria bacterium]